MLQDDKQNGGFIPIAPYFKTQNTQSMKTIQPTQPPKDFNDWISHIYSLIKEKK